MARTVREEPIHFTSQSVPLKQECVRTSVPDFLSIYSTADKEYRGLYVLAVTVVKLTIVYRIILGKHCVLRFPV